MKHHGCDGTALTSYAEPGIVIPLYNCEKTIRQLVEALVSTLSDHFSRFTIVLVNDGSRDATHEIAQEIQQDHSQCVKYIRLARNLAQFPFIRRCNERDKSNIEKLLHEKLADIKELDNVIYLDVDRWFFPGMSG